MRNYAWLFLSVGLVFSLVGCGDSGNGSGGSGGSAGSGGSGGSGTMVAVTGTVSAAALEGEPTALAGATVSVVGTSNTATSDADGNFSIMAPTGTVIFVATAAGNWGSQVADMVPSGGLDGLDLEVIPDGLATAIAAVLEVQIDPTEGLVAVSFDEDTVQGGETTTISSPSGGSFIFDTDDAPVIGAVLIEGGGSEAIFFNVDLADTVTADATSPQDTCPPEFPDAVYSVQAKVLTENDVVCPVQ